MGPKQIPVAAVQLACTPLNRSANLDRIADRVADACSRGSRLVVLPELTNTGYTEHVDLHSLAEDETGTTIQSLKFLARRFSVYLAAGFVERHRGDVYNSLAFLTPNGELSIYRKRHLIFWEHFYFKHGHEPLIVQTDLGRIGFAICADMMYRDVWSDYRNQIDLAVIIAAWPRRTPETGFPVGWMLEPSWSLAGKLPAHIARDLKVGVIFANHCGPCSVRIPQLGPATPAAFAARSGIFNAEGQRVTPEDEIEGISVGTIEVPQEKLPWVTLSA